MTAAVQHSAQGHCHTGSGFQYVCVTSFMLMTDFRNLFSTHFSDEEMEASRGGNRKRLTQDHS